MNRFEYLRPETVSDAVAAAAEPGSAYLAAGTNLLDLMKGGVARPARLVDVTRLPGLGDIEHLSDGGSAHRRARAQCRPRERPDLRHDLPGRRRSAAVGRLGAAPQRRHRRRQPDAAHTLRLFLRHRQRLQPARPGAGCDARQAEDRGQAVLGWSDACIATHPSDFCVPLVALDAVVEIEGTAGRTEVPLEDFHLLPGDTPERENVLEPGDLVVAVRLPAEAAGFKAHARYLKVRERTSFAFALASAAAALDIGADGKIREARLALGGVAPQALARARLPRPCSSEPRRIRRTSSLRRKPRFRRRGPPATTPSRSNSRSASSLRALALRRRRHAGTHAGPSASPFAEVPEYPPMAEISLPVRPRRATDRASASL